MVVSQPAGLTAYQTFNEVTCNDRGVEQALRLVGILLYWPTGQAGLLARSNAFVLG